ncbi:MAG TPA: type II CAAX endopeptidase family protein [Ferruginibacter sp.]|nr:type II CAAX endopeptidase family protein [Ferruginibacter sp.]
MATFDPPLTPPYSDLRPVWNRFFTLNWKFALFLLIFICIPRFILVLNANATGSYGSIGAIMLISALVPFIFLSKKGQQKAGLVKPSNYYPLLLAFALGLMASLLLHYAAQALYGSGNENWYAYIGRSYNIPAGIDSNDKRTMFIIMAATGMLFSPIGEEFFFRGLVHTGFQQSWGSRKASLADGLAFSLVHLSHFGIVYLNNNWHFLPLPATLWVTGMFLTSLLFAYCKRLTHSIWGAVICHSAFNLGMIYCIFYLL